MFRKPLVSLVVAASFALAGCGSHAAGTLSMASLPNKAELAKSPSIVTTVTRGEQVEHRNVERQHNETPAAPIAPQKPVAPLSTGSVLVLNGHVALTDEVLAEDAESQGYSIQAKDDESKLERKFSKTGLIRRTGDGFSLQPSNGLLKFFKKKQKDTFTLTGAPEVITQLAARENKKALIKGTVDKNNVVTVLSVKGLADLGFLTNWLSKGKIAGKAVDRATGLPLAGATVDAKSAEGFVFNTVSDADGSFQIKSLTPGNYTVTVKFAGYEPLVEADVTIEKRKAADVTAKLAPEEPASDEN